jgi:hypothetical protein
MLFSQLEALLLPSRIRVVLGWPSYSGGPGAFTCPPSSAKFRGYSD